MNLYEWEKQTHDMCPRCISRRFNQLHQEERNKLMESAAELYGIQQNWKG